MARRLQPDERGLIFCELPLLDTEFDHELETLEACSNYDACAHPHPVLDVTDQPEQPLF